MKSKNPSSITLNKAKQKAWKAFSKYIRLRDAIETTGTKTQSVCCTCGIRKNIFGSGCLQAGHFIPGRYNSILFEERGVFTQCQDCNVWERGKLTKYHEFMLKKQGKQVIDELFKLSRQRVQYKVNDYLEIADKYERKFKELNEKN